MLDLSPIHPGLIGSSSLVVAPEHTAPRVGSGRIAVLATPVMINVIEAAALAAVEHLLPAGHQSLGIQLDVATSRRRRSACASRPRRRSRRVEGRTITFRVEARDERELIGDGTHSAWSSTWRASTSACSARCAASRHRPRSSAR